MNFLRSHDELDLGRLTDSQRERVFRAFAPEKRMQLYNRGIRRRLAPMLDNDRRKMELAFREGLAFSVHPRGALTGCRRAATKFKDVGVNARVWEADSETT